jgi:hypothetical protein
MKEIHIAKMMKIIVYIKRTINESFAKPKTSSPLRCIAQFEKENLDVQFATIIINIIRSLNLWDLFKNNSVLLGPRPVGPPCKVCEYNVNYLTA